MTTRASLPSLLVRLGRLLVSEMRTSIPAIVLVLTGAVTGSILFGVTESRLLAILLPFIGVAVAMVTTSVGIARTNRHLLPRLLGSIGLSRVPFFSSFELRSPRIAIDIDRAWRGFESLPLSRIEGIARGIHEKASDRRDACLTLANWHLVHGDTDRAAKWLQELDEVCAGRVRRRLSRRNVVLLLAELRALTDTGPDVDSRTVGRRRWGLRSSTGHQFDYAQANLVQPFDPVRVVNDALKQKGLQTIRFKNSWFDSAAEPNPTSRRIDGPLVTVVVPVHDGATTIREALVSISRQTWKNLEIIVVDDASRDQTRRVVEAYQVEEPRLRLVTLAMNSGPYAARNSGVRSSHGEFVTILDADDWMHPQRIEVQVGHLLAHPKVVANRTSLIRVVDDGRVVRRGVDFGDFVGPNTASLLVRREVLLRIGPWDPIRAGADSELLDRLRATFGVRAVVDIHRHLPLTICRSRQGSLTADRSTGMLSIRWDNGARNLYRQSYSWWHRRTQDSPVMPPDHEPVSRRFPAPIALLRRDRVVDLDVVLLSDLSLPGGTTASNIEELKANQQFGLITGLVHNRAPSVRYLPINSKFFSLPTESSWFLSASDRIECDVLMVKYPPAALDLPDRFPDIHVRGDVVIAVNQAPWTGYQGDRREVYRILDVDRTLRSKYGKDPVWAPIGPAIRDALDEHHASELSHIQLSDHDWYEIIDPSEWFGTGNTRSEALFRIGRHARDSVWKWPASREELLAAYPNESDIEVSILGGADIPRRILGRLPTNWRVAPFDSITPLEYLRTLDALVYYPHPDMTEGFGRTILEAMALGLSVITDPRFAPLFGDSVITVPPDGVAREIHRLRADSDHRTLVGQRARQAAVERFGYTAHLTRLRHHGLQR